MTGFEFLQSDDAIVLVGCFAVIGISALVLQLVHFIQHRQRPGPSIERPAQVSRHSSEMQRKAA